MLKVCF